MSASCAPTQVQTWPLSIDVSSLLPVDGCFALGGWLLGPQDPPDGGSILVCCLAGGGCRVSAFDAEVAGLADVSFARHLASFGFYVAAFDHPGIGSSTPVPDVYMLDASTVAAAQAHAVAEITRRLAEGAVSDTLGPIELDAVVGVGHSMGGMVLDVAQARHRPFHALAVVGHGGGGLPEVLTEEELALVGVRGPELEAAIRRLARKRFDPRSTVPAKLPAHGTFFTDDVPPELVDVSASQQAELLYHCGLQVLIPGSTAVEMAAIDVPLFLGYGEHDLISPTHDVVASYPSATDVTLFVLAGAGHMVFHAANRTVLWDRIATWIQSVAVTAGRRG